MVGVPVPIVGSVIGAFLGAFAGAALFEYTVSRTATVAVRAGWGAVLGRAAGAAAKIALGGVIAVIGGFAAGGRGRTARGPPAGRRPRAGPGRPPPPPPPGPPPGRATRPPS